MALLQRIVRMTYIVLRRTRQQCATADEYMDELDDSGFLISMAAGYVYSRLCDASSRLIKTWVPYRYMRGKNQGKVEGKYRRWDMRLRAGGEEGIVEELRHRVWAYEQQRFDVLQERWNAASGSGSYVLIEDLEKAAEEEMYLLAEYIEVQLGDIRARQPNVVPIRTQYRTIA